MIRTQILIIRATRHLFNHVLLTIVTIRLNDRVAHLKSPRTNWALKINTSQKGIKHQPSLALKINHNLIRPHKTMPKANLKQESRPFSQSNLRKRVIRNVMAAWSLNKKLKWALHSVTQAFIRSKKSKKLLKLIWKSLPIHKRTKAEIWSLLRWS